MKKTTQKASFHSQTALVMCENELKIIIMNTVSSESSRAYSVLHSSITPSTIIEKKNTVQSNNFFFTSSFTECYFQFRISAFFVLYAFFFLLRCFVLFYCYPNLFLSCSHHYVSFIVCVSPFFPWCFVVNYILYSTAHNIEAD